NLFGTESLCQPVAALIGVVFKQHFNLRCHSEASIEQGQGAFTGHICRLPNISLIQLFCALSLSLSLSLSHTFLCTSLSLCVCLFVRARTHTHIHTHTHTHTRTRAHTHARTHAHTQTQKIER